MRRQEILLKMADHKRKRALPEIKPRRVRRFCNAQQLKLYDRASAFVKKYLRPLVAEIRTTGNQAEITGSKAV